MPIRNLYDLPMTRSRVRDGQGECLGATAFKGEEFASPLTGVGITVIPPGSSIGPHPHDDLEEIYVIADGTGIATLDGKVQRVRKGDVMVNLVNGVHGLANDGDEELVIFAFAVGVE